MTTNLAKSLSSKDQLEFDKFENTLPFIHEDFPFLALIGTTTPPLMEILRGRVAELLPDALQVSCREPKNIYAILSQHQAQKVPLIVSLDPQSDADTLSITHQLFF